MGYRSRMQCDCRRQCAREITLREMERLTRAPITMAPGAPITWLITRAPILWAPRVGEFPSASTFIALRMPRLGLP